MPDPGSPWERENPDDGLGYIQPFSPAELRAEKLLPRGKYHATCDYLAAELSRKTGTTFTVIRGRVPVYDNRPERTVVRYALKASRPFRHRPNEEPFDYTFQQNRPMTLREITAWLASINDMINMNFIPVDPYRKGSER